MTERDNNPNEKSSRPKTQSDSNFNSAKSQRERLMTSLRAQGSCSSIEATHKLDIIHPPRRIMELRNEGHRIDTVWSYEPTECGRVHRVGRYHLIKEANQ
jgi:hypothetical protein